MNVPLPPRGLHLFQGDSITDAGRDRNSPDSLGGGYALFVAARHSLSHADRAVRFLNRGCSGHRVRDLEARWTGDCIALQPDVLSILIGVNEVWRRYDAQDPTRVEDYEAGYRRLLERVRRETRARLVLLEPFLLHVPADRQAWREDLDPKRDVVRRLARDYDACFIPLDEKFADAARVTGPAYWAADGVHPTPAGHALIAEALLECLA
jgi:lysophospholipase L1-like esterase